MKFTIIALLATSAMGIKLRSSVLQGTHGLAQSDPIVPVVRDDSNDVIVDHPDGSQTRTSTNGDWLSTNTWNDETGESSWSNISSKDGSWSKGENSYKTNADGSSDWKGNHEGWNAPEETEVHPNEAEGAEQPHGTTEVAELPHVKEGCEPRVGCDDLPAHDPAMPLPATTV